MPKLNRKMISLTPADVAAMVRIRDHFGLPSTSAAIRYAIQQEARRLDATPGPGRKAPAAKP